MASIYGNFSDSPGQIKREGQDITIRFIRTSETTGLITWNIPRPSAGCDSTTQAYDGIVVTIDNVAANYISTSPTDSKYYDADPTGDRDLHVGSKLDTAMVVGAFYSDKKTTSLVITGLSPKTPYYVSGYAVDAQARYHREGVHAYSLPTGVDNKLSDDQSSYHDISIVSSLPLSLNSLTGLEATREYTFSIQKCCKRNNFTINGRDALTYRDLVMAINAAFAQATCTYRGPNPPNSGEYYLDIPNESLYLWDGWKNIEQDVIWSTIDPTVPVLGTYWYQPDLNKLFVHNSFGWSEVFNIINQESDPTIVVCGQIWFDGTDAWEWDGNHWSKLCVIESTRNPLFPPIMTCNTFWYNTKDQELFQWSDSKKWESALAVYWDVNPNVLIEGTYWFDENTETMMQLIGGDFIEVSIWSRESDSDGAFPAPPIPTPGMYWLIPSTGAFYQRNSSNSDWTELKYLSYPTDPRMRDTGDLWWNSSTDRLYAWDELNLDWLEVSKFYQSELDPRIPPTLPECAIWYNPDTKQMVKILSANCDVVDTIFSAVDPTNLYIGYIWYWKNVWKEWDGVKWTVIDPIISNFDPFVVNDGVFWYDVDTMELFDRVNGSWILTPYSTIPLVPNIGNTWFNTIENIFMEWDGVTWIPAMPIAFVEFRARTCKEEYEALRFKTKRKGCSECSPEFEIIVEAGNLFSYLRPSVMYNDPVGGSTGLVGGPTYLQLGIGDDGSPVERRQLADTIRRALGYPSVTVELTKEQIDDSIDIALATVRKRSSYSYERALFFMDLLPNQQVYLMTNECVGYNKIVDINTIYRTRGSQFKGAYAWNDSFSMAALQQMYTLGTFDILTFHLTAQYAEILSELFAERIMFQWNEHTRLMKLHNVIGNRERVLIDCVIERTEQSLIQDRELHDWIRRWAIAECKMMLSNIRGKFTTLPGPNGSTTLNSQELITQSENEKTQLLTEMEDTGLYQDIINVGARSSFLIG